jgi:hypothetical protein
MGYGDINGVILPASAYSVRLFIKCCHYTLKNTHTPSVPYYHSSIFKTRFQGVFFGSPSTFLRGFFVKTPILRRIPEESSKECRTRRLKNHVFCVFRRCFLVKCSYLEINKRCKIPFVDVL